MKRRLQVTVSLLLVASGLLLSSCSKSESNSSAVVFYGRVCLGPDKSNQNMVLRFIVQGPDIYLDRNQDNLAQPDERLQGNELSEIDDPAAEVKYQLKELRLTKGVELVSKDLPQCLAMTVTISGKVNYDQIGQIFMSADPEAPQWIHFHGRNRMIFGDPDVQLLAKEKHQLKVYFGTNAVGEGRDLGTEKMLEADRNADWATIGETDRFATIVPKQDGVYPVMSIEIPTSGESFVQQIPLNEFC